MLEVAKPAGSGFPERSTDPVFRKLAMLLVGTLKSPKL
jgi:hypothetical protein